MLEKLYQPIGGLMTHPNKLPQSPGEPEYSIYSARLGDLNQVSLFHGRNFGYPMQMDGAGGDIDDQVAKLKSEAETLERYCSCAYTDEQFIYATANELGEKALDLDQIPIVSDSELAHPHCPIQRPNKNEKIRWVKGLSLTRNRPVYIPAIMTYLYIPYTSLAEQFWLPISTGCAIHTSYEKAMINGICEVVERDAISLVWLNQLDIPKIEINTQTLSKQDQQYVNRTMEHPFIETQFYDATTDIGIPTIYCLQRSPYNKKMSSIVMCTTDLNPTEALTKITREAASLRIALQNQEMKTENIEQFGNVSDGALYMAQPKMNSAFDFLTNSKKVTSFESMKDLSTGSDQEDLKKLVEMLRKKGHEIFVVDQTSDEAKRSNFKAVRVIIPTLQPLSFHYRAQFKGSERLYKGPVNMGYRMKSEGELNQYPQPFA